MERIIQIDDFLSEKVLSSLERGLLLGARPLYRWRGFPTWDSKSTTKSRAHKSCTRRWPRLLIETGESAQRRSSEVYSPGHTIRPTPGIDMVTMYSAPASQFYWPALNVIKV